MKEFSKKKKIAFSVLAIAFLACICVILWAVSASSKEEPEEGGKSITIEVVSERDSYSSEKKYSTDEQYLGDFLEKEGIIGFDKTEYGRFVTSVNGYEAKDEDQSWWCIYVNGQSAVTGVDEIVVEDGSVYKLELTIGW